MYYVVKPAVTDSGMRPLFAGTTTDVSRLVENGVASVTETEAYTGKICFGVSDDNVWEINVFLLILNCLIIGVVPAITVR